MPVEQAETARAAANRTKNSILLRCCHLTDGWVFAIQTDGLFFGHMARRGNLP